VAVDLGELAFGSGQADVHALDFAGPAVALGFGDAVDQGVADLGDAGPLGGSARTRFNEIAGATAYTSGHIQ
jgi:hypothetical protein